VSDVSDDMIPGGLTLRAVAGCRRIVIFPAGTVSVQYPQHLYYNEIEMVLTWLNWQQPLAEHGVRVVASSKQSK